MLKQTKALRMKMILLTVSEARDHCRLDDDYPEEQLLPYMNAAVDYVAAHLNRAVFADDEALTEAASELPASLGLAFDEYANAVALAKNIDNVAQRNSMIDVAQTKYEAQKLAAKRIINGVVINGAIRAAMLLTLGHLFANREASVVGASVASLPTGVPELLRPFRLVQMP